MTAYQTLQELETPAFIVNELKLTEGIHSFKNALQSSFPNNILAYSLKTNQLPYVLKKVSREGGYIEVVSSDEFDMAQCCQIPVHRLVYNGPLKSKTTFLQAIREGAIVNIETFQELNWLQELPTDRQFQVGIRLNLNFEVLSPGDAKEGEDFSRFGFSEESGEFEKVLKRIAQFPHLSVKGIHVHYTSVYRAITAYKQMATYVGKIAKKHALLLDYIDLGGGYYGIMEGKPTYDQYCNAIREGLLPYFNLEELTVIVEPGNALVAAAFDFVSSIIDVKRVKESYVATIDGSRNDIDVFFKKDRYFSEVLQSDSEPRTIVKHQVIGGATCLEYDRLYELHETPLVKPGDKIWFKSVGAYTFSFATLFIRYFPAIYLQDAQGYRLIRKRWSAADFFPIYDTSE